MDEFKEAKDKATDLLMKYRELNTLYSIKELIDTKLASTIGEGDWVEGYVVGLDIIKDEVIEKIKKLKEQ